MKRVLTLASLMIQDLLRSLASIVPIASTFAFGLIAFEYGMDQPQFATVAGIGMGAICLVTALVLASRANRAISYLLVARLHRRTELLVSLMLASLLITATLSLFMTLANLLAGRLTLEFPSVLWIALSWFPLWLLAAALALPLSGLVGRGGSHLAGYLLLSGLLIANDRRAFLARHGMSWLSRIVETILWPVNTLLARASAGTHDWNYTLAWTLTCAYSVLLFTLAASLFGDKDLLWSE